MEMPADTETVPRRGQLSRQEWGPIYMKWMPQSSEWLGDQDRRVSAGGGHLTGRPLGWAKATLGCHQATALGQVLKSWPN